MLERFIYLIEVQNESVSFIILTINIKLLSVCNKTRVMALLSEQFPFVILVQISQKRMSSSAFIG